MYGIFKKIVDAAGNVLTMDSAGRITSKLHDGTTAVDVTTNGHLEVSSYDKAHDEQHLGNAYSVCITDADADTADTDPLALGVTAPDNREIHFEWAVSTSLSAKIEFIVKTTLTNGVDIKSTVINNNDNSQNTTDASAVLKGSEDGTALTITGGTTIATFNVGTSGGNVKIGGNIGSRQEHILKNTSCAVRVTALENNCAINICGDWYELTV